VWFVKPCHHIARLILHVMPPKSRLATSDERIERSMFVDKKGIVSQ
jgi:hypothetical protein